MALQWQTVHAHVPSSAASSTPATSSHGSTRSTACHSPSIRRGRATLCLLSLLSRTTYDAWHGASTTWCLCIITIHAANALPPGHAAKRTTNVRRVANATDATTTIHATTWHVSSAEWCRPPSVHATYPDSYARTPILPPEPTTTTCRSLPHDDATWRTQWAPPIRSRSGPTADGPRMSMSLRYAHVFHSLFFSTLLL